VIDEFAAFAMPLFVDLLNKGGPPNVVRGA
jgi:hypothetical protein